MAFGDDSQGDIHNSTLEYTKYNGDTSGLIPKTPTATAAGDSAPTTTIPGSNPAPNSKNMFGDAVKNLTQHWQLVVAGQVMSFLLASTGAAQATLYVDCQFSAPTFTVGFFYFILAVGGLLPIYLRTRKERLEAGHVIHTVSPVASEREQVYGLNEDGIMNSRHQVSKNPPRYMFLGGIPLHAPVWAYFSMAVLDVYANFFTVLAFKYTTITSVTLFDALAIPSAMILSKLFLRRQYSLFHLMGVASCMIGIMINVTQDYEQDKKHLQDGNADDYVAKEYPDRLKGDLLAITGGILIGANNVLGEVAVRDLGGVAEYLGMLGFFATIICTIQTAIFEIDDIKEFFGKGDKTETCQEQYAWGILTAYCIAAVLSYVGASRFLQVSEATFYNLSLLTGDLWSVLFSVVAERILPKPLFFLAFVFIVSGVFIYEMAPSPVLEDRAKENANSGHHQQVSNGAWREAEIELENVTSALA